MVSGAGGKAPRVAIVGATGAVGVEMLGCLERRRFPLSLPFDNPEGGAARRQAETWSALLGWEKPVHFIWGGDDAVFTEAWGRASSLNMLRLRGRFRTRPDAAHPDEDA